MNRRGVEFTVTQVEPGLWKWQFQIDETVTTGKTYSNLMGMAAHRVQQRIDRELNKAEQTRFVKQSRGHFKSDWSAPVACFQIRPRSATCRA
jgi:hypothetical protein